jgi:hypothetical protein
MNFSLPYYILKRELQRIRQNDKYSKLYYVLFKRTYV